jgi:hypothetical protein
MRAIAIALTLAAALSACGSDDPTPATPGDSTLATLTIRVDPDGPNGSPPNQLKLDCDAPTDSRACGEAAGVSAADLAPTPPGTACTEIFGGPQTATINGTIRGNPVDARFSRSDGCEIARWERVQDLLAEVK